MSFLITYCEIPVSINSIDVMGITRLAESSIHRVWLIVVIIRDGTKPKPSTRSIGYRVIFKVSVSPKNPIPIPSTFRYYFDTFSILYNYGYFNIKLQ